MLIFFKFKVFLVFNSSYKFDGYFPFFQNMIIVVGNRKMKTGLVWKILNQGKKSEPKSRITQI